MVAPKNTAVFEYIVAMLEQLADLARRDGRVKLADRISTVVLAEKLPAFIDPANAGSNRKPPLR